MSDEDAYTGHAWAAGIAFECLERLLATPPGESVLGRFGAVQDWLNAARVNVDGMARCVAAMQARNAASQAKGRA